MDRLLCDLFGFRKLCQNLAIEAVRIGILKIFESNLRLLDLQFNQLRREGIAAILRVKETHPTLTHVALHGNGVSNTTELQAIK